MNEEFLENLSDELYVCIGRAMHTWAKLELQLYDYLRDVGPSEKVYKRLFKAHKSIPDRCALLLSFVEKNYQVHSNFFNELEGTLSDIEKLAEKRNKIAHNPVLFWIEEESGNSELVNGIIDGKNGRFTKFDMEQINEFSGQVDDARFRLIKSMLNFSRK